MTKSNNGAGLEGCPLGIPTTRSGRIRNTDISGARELIDTMNRANDEAERDYADCPLAERCRRYVRGYSNSDGTIIESGCNNAK